MKLSQKSDPCDPTTNNGVPCTCATIYGLVFSVIELLLYMIALVFFIVKNRKNENKKRIYGVMFVTVIALGTHAVQTITICTHVFNCVKTTKLVTLFVYLP